MSRDLSAYLPERPDRERLAGAARAAGLELDPSGTLLRDGRYCADLGDPQPVEPGEIPTQVEPSDVAEPLASQLAACRWSVAVVVQGSGAADVERAVAFARALVAGTGVVEDPATGLWAGGAVHAPRPRGDRLVDVVELRWFARRADAPPDLPHRWLAACRARLPAALPRRFDTTEPLRRRFDTEGDAGFAAVHGGETLYFRATRPCFEGSVAGPGRGRVAAHSMVLDRAVDPAALLGLFVDLAGATAAFWASAAVQRGLTWTGRALYGPGPDQTLYLAPGGTWLGLPAAPVAWSWFGPAYRRLVPRSLPTEPAGAGLLHRWSPELLDRDALPAAWLPPELTAASRDEPAARVPRGLRPTTWDALRGRA